MKPILIKVFILALVFSFSCRYKDNTSPSLLPVKIRLMGTWKLKEAHLIQPVQLNLIDADPSLLGETISFKRDFADQILMRTEVSKVYLNCKLENNKTEITLKFTNGEKAVLKITRLTQKELWMEGNPVFYLCNRDSMNEFLSLKYDAQ